MLASHPAWLEQPSITEARAYLVKHHGAKFMQYDAMRFERNGFSLYFTIVASGERTAYVVKLCEDANGHVKGSSNVSNGEPSC